jgi:hypothetical protein
MSDDRFIFPRWVRWVAVANFACYLVLLISLLRT